MADRDIKYMARCLELAQMGAGYVSTNPMVGSVIVCDDMIIGEGYHRYYGEAHAEVNAIESVKDESLLSRSTLYVNLEPCSHFGKTPPCCDLIISKKIKKVVVAMQDPFALVSGEGINRMREAGVEVVLDVLKSEAEFLNRRFITFHTKHRPYIIIKYARTIDGYIDNDRDVSVPATWLTGYASKCLVHKWRAEEDAIMVGTNTVVRDNPELTVREWKGDSPIRITIDRNSRIEGSSKILNSKSRTIVFTDESIEDMFSKMYDEGIQSIIIEGGKAFIENLVKKNYYDEVREFVSPLCLDNLKGGNGKGVKSPDIMGMRILHREKIGNVELVHWVK